MRELKNRKSSHLFAQKHAAMKMMRQSPNRVNLEYYFLSAFTDCPNEEKARQWEEMRRVMRSTCNMT